MPRCRGQRDRPDHRGHDRESGEQRQQVGEQADADRAGAQPDVDARDEGRRDLTAAISRCQSVVPSSASHSISCALSAPNAVTATVTWQVPLPVPLFMTSATVRSTRTGQAVFGGQQALP